MHVDMDAFYVSVELRNRPELRGTPVIVGGSPRGVVLSASYEARATGVRSGISSTQARRLAPRATFLRPDFDAYTAVSKAIVEVFRSVSSVVEAASIDEAYLDVTGSVRMFGPPARSESTSGRWSPTSSRSPARSASVRTSSSPRSPPVRPSRTDSSRSRPGVVGFLHPLPVQAMFGVGPATTERLNRLGLFTVADLAHTPRGTPAPRLRAARRRRPAPPGLGTRRPAGRQLRAGAQCWLAGDLRPGHRRPRGGPPGTAADGRSHRQPDAQGRMVGRTVTLSVRFADFTELTRSATLPTATDVTDEIYAEAVALYERLGLDRARIRRVGVRVEGLIGIDRADRQPRLTDPEHGWREAEQAVDAAVGRFGPAAVQRAILTRREYGTRREVYPG